MLLVLSYSDFITVFALSIVKAISFNFPDLVVSLKLFQI